MNVINNFFIRKRLHVVVSLKKFAQYYLTSYIKTFNNKCPYFHRKENTIAIAHRDEMHHEISF